MQENEQSGESQHKYPEITREIATKVRDVVDKGLVHGVGRPVPGQMCVEAAVCFALGLPHSDDPPCVSRAVRSLKIQLNDLDWSSDGARAKGLRRLALAQLGSEVIDDADFSRRVIEIVIRRFLPIALRAAASVRPDQKHKDALEEQAKNCEQNPAARAAARAAAEAAARAAWAAAEAAREAAQAARAAEAARAAAEAAAWAAEAAAWAAAEAAAWAAMAAAAATDNHPELRAQLNEIFEPLRLQVLEKFRSF